MVGCCAVSAAYGAICGAIVSRKRDVIRVRRFRRAVRCAKVEPGRYTRLPARHERGAKYGTGVPRVLRSLWFPFAGCDEVMKLGASAGVREITLPSGQYASPWCEHRPASG